MAIDALPQWMSQFSPEDLEFVKRLILSSGSLKELSKLYGVSYPTIRLRLNRLIACIKLADSPEPDPFISFIKRTAVNGKIDGSLAKEIIEMYKQRSAGTGETNP